jgi:NitT/TauT family transport system permease protein
LDALNATPRIAIAPVFIIVFGIGMSAKIALAFTVVVFMIISAARSGIHAANPDVLRLMTVMGASKPQIFFKVLLPVATPSIFAGLRLGLVYSLLGVVTSELLASRDGLGQLIALYSGTFQLDRVYAIIFVLIVISGGLNAIFTSLERRLTRWKALDDA